MEAWLFPNTLLMQAAPPGVGVQQKQEWDYINRMRLRSIDAIGSMHKLWNSYVCEDLLDIEAPCQRLLDIKAAGVKHVRIPVGWWIAEPPTEVPSEYAKTDSTAYSNRDKGYTKVTHMHMSYIVYRCCCGAGWVRVWRGRLLGEAAQNSEAGGDARLPRYARSPRWRRQADGIHRYLYNVIYGLTCVYILGMYQYYIWLSGYYMSICSGLHTLSAGVYRQVV